MTPKTCVLAIAIAAMNLDSMAVAQSAAPQRPAFKLLRQDEDWSKFRAQPGGEWLDPLKHVALDDTGEWWASFGGRLETRYEVWDGVGFGASPNNADEYALTRLFLHGDFHFGDQVRVYIEGKSAQANDRNLPGGRRTLDVDTAAVEQAFVDYSGGCADGAFRLRAGRQQLLFGAQRLISPLPWANTMRTWDGVTARWTKGPWTINLLETWYVPVDSTETNERAHDQELYGIYATRAPDKGGVGLDVYLLGNKKGISSSKEHRRTLGARGWGGFSERGDWEAEVAIQTGEVGNEDISAWSIAAVAGWKLDEPACEPRLFAGFDAASGDSSAGGKVKTFNQLYPLGHAYFGYIDVVGRQNILAFNVGASAKLCPKTTASATLHWFDLMEDDDRLYSAGGVASGPVNSTHVGEEFDLLVKRVVSSHASVYFGYSHFFAGDVADDIGDGDDIDFLYVGAGLTF